MSINNYPLNKQLSPHFNSNEFLCPHCNTVKLSTELILKLEELFSLVHAKKCIISSGYRCPTYDKKQNGFAGRHSEGLACDCCYYDKSGKIIPSKIICCIAWDIGFTGIAYINNNYTHLDVRKNSTYYGDETRGNSSYWTNPYTYFNISKSEVEKYTGKNLLKINYQSHGLNKKWYPNVQINNKDYAGVFGISMDGLYIDKLTYRVKANNRWLPPVIGRNDYAGIIGKPITDIAISGNIKYRVHLKSKNIWLPFVYGKNYNIKDKEYGYAGNGSIIDAIEIRNT